MATPDAPDTTFLVVICAACGLEDLACLGIGEDGEPTLLCQACDSPVGDALREVESAALEDLGYAILQARACGNGGGCGSGGCGTRRPPVPA